MASAAVKTPLRWSHLGDGEMLEWGVDESGRGSLCGPVYAAAVSWGLSDDQDREARLRADPRMRLVRDSKKLSPAQREKARAFIEAEALAWGVASVEAVEIDKINILKASMLAMRHALDRSFDKLETSGDPVLSGDAADGLAHFVVVDGDRFEGYVHPGNGELVPYACVPDADALYLSVAAASILAKTHRDRHVVDVLHPKFPGYGWDRNKGYGTAEHIRAITEKGACDEHRKTFAPIRAKEGPRTPWESPFRASSSTVDRGF